MFQRNHYVGNLMPFIGKKTVKVLTGMRRSGKSCLLESIQEFLLKQGIQENQIIIIDFDKPENSHLLETHTLLNELIRLSAALQEKAYIFLDEIQEVADWESCVNFLLSTQKFDIYITGSCENLLEKEISLNRQNKYIEFSVYSFSFKEFYRYYPSLFTEDTELRYKTKELFWLYIKLGGLPFLANMMFVENPCKEYLRDLFNTIVVKDIVMRKNIRDVSLLEKVFIFICNNIGETYSATAIAKNLNSMGTAVSVDTVLYYLSALEDACVISRVNRKDILAKKIISTKEKFYVLDHGLRNAICPIMSDDIKAILENVVYVELKRRKYTVLAGKCNNKDIDFIAEKRGEKIYIQVAYLLDTFKPLKREFSVFDSITDHYPKYVFSMDDRDFSQNGIIHINIIEWLLK